VEIGWRLLLEDTLHPLKKASDAQEPMNSFLARLREVESRFLLIVFQPLMDSLFGFAYLITHIF
jgi:hypothetical protein